MWKTLSNFIRHIPLIAHILHRRAYIEHYNNAWYHYQKGNTTIAYQLWILGHYIEHNAKGENP
jgi:hypothetical protein